MTTADRRPLSALRGHARWTYARRFTHAHFRAAWQLRRLTVLGIYPAIAAGLLTLTTLVATAYAVLGFVSPLGAVAVAVLGVPVLALLSFVLGALGPFRPKNRREWELIEAATPSGGAVAVHARTRPGHGTKLQSLWADPIGTGEAAAAIVELVDELPRPQHLRAANRELSELYAGYGFEVVGRSTGRWLGIPMRRTDVWRAR